MQKLTDGKYVVVEPETLEEALKKHWCPFESIEHCLKDTVLWHSDGTKFEIMDVNESNDPTACSEGKYEIKNGKAVKIG